MRLTLQTPPADTPVDLASAKLHCRVDTDADDAIVTALVQAATQHLDGPSGVLGRAIMQQTWLLELADWPETLTLPVEPVASFSVTYYDANGAEQTLSSDSYVTSTWPSFGTEWRWREDIARPVLDEQSYPVKFTIVAGYANAAAVPAPLKTAILMLVAHWYETREAVITGTISGETPLAVSALIAPYRKHL